jgi:cyclopropane fatty-acyl-phospholipid synthase-like methyltransferase
MKRHAPATLRNRDAIVHVLARVLPPSGVVLEIGSGSGEHAVYFADKLPGIEWQPSDDDEAALASIEAYRAEARLPNLRAPLRIDARAGDWPIARADAVVSINMIHIAPWSACQGLMRGASRLLPPGGVLYLYGPFRDGARTAPSNERFDESLRARDPASGVRELGEVTREAEAHGLARVEVVEMPANNLSVIFRAAGASSVELGAR